MFKGFSDLLSFEQRLQVGSHQVEVKEQLAEGGYAFIYRAVEAGSNAEWALKKIICQSQERLQLAQAEVAVLRRLPLQEIIRVIWHLVLQTVVAR